MDRCPYNNIGWCRVPCGSGAIWRYRRNWGWYLLNAPNHSHNCSGSRSHTRHCYMAVS
ncbi:MAG TPA: hypothetical protein ENF41_01780 [Candidatus Bathyarchaeota archaeon]|nr:hypothetical protein [Candidatus Bathyarchaeota archaeon]